MPDECAVCLERLDSEKATKLVCGHAYHSSCIGQWLDVQATCPSCRAFVANDELQKLLRIASDPAFFGTRQAHKGILRHYPTVSNGSLYRGALECARRSLDMLFAKNPAYRLELAYMLAYLHVYGDARAAEVARTANVSDSFAIAAGLIKWSMRAEHASFVRHRPARRCPFLW